MLLCDASELFFILFYLCERAAAPFASLLSDWGTTINRPFGPTIYLLHKDRGRALSA